MQEIDFENISEDEEEFRGPYIKKSDRLSGDKIRKSKRLLRRSSHQDDEDEEVENTTISPSRINSYYGRRRNDSISDDAKDNNFSSTGAVSEEESRKSVDPLNVPIPDSSCDEAGNGRKSRQLNEVEKEDLDAMIRSASRLDSRPDSQADKRTDSRLSRPSSALPSKVARQLEDLGSPERDSPVLTPRQRQKEKKELKFVKQEKLTASSTPAINDNYLRKPVIDDDEALNESFGSFTQAYSRKKQSEKVRKLLEKQRRKAERISNKKYKGFGEDSDKPTDKEQRKKERAEKKIKKAQVSKQEADIIKELMSIGEAAVAESKVCKVEEEPLASTSSCQPECPDPQVLEELAQLQTIEQDRLATNLSAELDSLFDI